MHHHSSRLILAADRGLYAIDAEAEPFVLNAGMSLDILLGGSFHHGTVQYNPDPIYAQLGPQFLGDLPQGPDGIGGYYFESEDGSTICGLCAGMVVRKSSPLRRDPGAAT